MIIHGDSLQQLKTIPENSVDAVVTDPPYELVSMGLVSPTSSQNLNKTKEGKNGDTRTD